MPSLFSYGTLRQPEVQRGTFGRELACEPDSLPGFRAATAGPHADAQFTGNPADRVDGVALDLTETELSASDEYERAFDYERIRVTLSSGRDAWVYVYSPATRGSRS